jgi:hypothetical protein
MGIIEVSTVALITSYLTNNYLQNTTQKTEDPATRSTLK